MACKRIGIIGSGNWGSAIAKLLGENVCRSSEYDHAVTMWVYEEVVGGKNLSEIINTQHENVKYLPGITLPENVRAEPDLVKVAKEADVLVFVIPHEFLLKTLESISSVVKPGAIAVSLIKGVYFEKGEISLISAKIKALLKIPVCTLMGANIALDVAKESFSECTLGYEDEEAGASLSALFTSAYFQVSAVKASGESEICGVLKNVVALGCGIVSGRNHGPNAVAAVIRNGFIEIIKFCDVFLQQTSTDVFVSRVFLESCGVADIIVSCSSGRNFKYSKMAAEKNEAISSIEASVMNGQKLQGYSTAVSLLEFLEENGKQDTFPVLYAIAKAAQTDLSAESILLSIRQKSTSQ
ncbi:glycerol-3-phosphate dehydrogenase (NAD+) [Nematocida sp. AWRm77]|nr:glycerol-3-phosphate dehydrogenase (NAD+) [Nematocida sp. AWRm77]